MRSRKNELAYGLAGETRSAPLFIGQTVIPVSFLSLEQTTRALTERATRQETTWVVTLNWEMASRAELDRCYALLLARADWVIPDGFPIAVRLRRSGVPAARGATRVAGVDLVASLLREIARDGRNKIAIIGGNELRGTLTRLAFPEELIGFLCEERVDPGDQWQVERLVKALRSSGARFVFLALGVPKQDQLAVLLRSRLPGICLLGVGGTFDYLGGRKKRAPRWMQTIGLEWLWRLTSEPRHTARRYLFLYPAGLFLFALRATARRIRRAAE